MDRIGAKIKDCIMYISLQERQKRDLLKYEEKVRQYIDLDEDRQDLKYINLKTQYEHKKNVLLAFMVAIIVAILTGIWKTFYEFGARALEYIGSIQRISEEYAKIAIIMFFIIVVALSIIFVLIIMAHIHNMRKTYKDLLIIENIRENGLKK